MASTDPAAVAPRHREPPRQEVVWSIAVAAVVGVAGSYWVAFTSDHLSEPGLQASLLNWIILSYVFSGLVAWSRRPDSQFGPMMVAAGFVTLLTTLNWSNAAALSTIGLALDYLPPTMFLHVYLAYPSGRLRGPLERALVGVAYVGSAGFSLVRLLLGAFGSLSLLSVVDEPILERELERVQLLLMAALAVGGIAALVVRRIGDESLRRSGVMLVDSFAVALAMIALLFTSAAFFSGVPWWGWEQFRRVTFFIVGAAPVAFLIGLLQARLARTSVGDLLVELRDDPQPRDLRDSLARTLRDPTLTVAYWLPQFDSWADGDGQPVELPEPGSTRATTLIDRNGVTVAALVHDRSLREEPELVEAVSAAAGIALENGRLHAELRARVEELAGSRARVIDAEQRERQRLERNLHDGAQQRLVSLSLELGLLEEQLASDPASAVARVERARRTVTQSLAELRDLARGIHPAVVSAHGLAVALEELAANAPVRVALSIDLDRRLPEPLEVAAYYLVSEALANIAKHADAATATVDVSRSNGMLVVEVTDDGVGGADTERGSGLRGLADRVESLGGRLRVWSPTGAGTRVRGELPCVS